VTLCSLLSNGLQADELVQRALKEFPQVRCRVVLVERSVVDQRSRVRFLFFAQDLEIQGMRALRIG
jgi:hypothetical protein